MLHRGLSVVPKLFPSYSACWEGTIPGSAATSFLLMAMQVGKHPALAKPPSRRRFPVQVQARSQPRHVARLHGHCRGGPSHAGGTAGLGRGAQVRVSHSPRGAVATPRWSTPSCWGRKERSVVEGNCLNREAMGRCGKKFRVGTGPFAKNKWRKNDTLFVENPCLWEIPLSTGSQNCGSVVLPEPRSPLLSPGFWGGSWDGVAAGTRWP